jgi:hypothetical protein
MIEKYRLTQSILEATREMDWGLPMNRKSSGEEILDFPGYPEKNRYTP